MSEIKKQQSCDCKEEKQCHCHEEKHEHSHDCHCHEGHDHDHVHDCSGDSSHNHDCCHNEKGHSHGCCCGDFSHPRNEDEENPKAKLSRIIASSILLLVCVIVERTFVPSMWVRLAMFAVPYVVAGYDVLAAAWQGIRDHDPFDESLLMAVSTLGAFAIGFLPGGSPEFAEAVFVMLFYQVGELIQDSAVDKSRDSIEELMDIRPDAANVERAGEVVTVAPAEVALGELIIIRPGERVPLDGIVVEGNSSLDTVALTGESLPRTIGIGDEAISGCVNQSGTLRVRVTSSAGESTASRILDLVEGARERKSHSERFITRFAHYYTPLVVFAALALAILPPLVSGNFVVTFPTWALRALTFLVVSCPCALMVSVPLSFFGGLGGASRQGILIKGGNYLEALAAVDTVAFDKTGTLTRGAFKVTAVHDIACVEAGEYSNGRGYAGLDACDEDERRLLHLAAHVESFSTHPIALALRQAYPETDDDCKVSTASEIAGQGVVATVDGRRVAVGNERLMETEGARFHRCEHAGAAGTVIHVAIDGVYAGHVVIADEIKTDAAESILAMREAGVTKTVMLTGDRQQTAAEVAGKVGVDEYHAELLPGDKVKQVERLLAAEKTGGKLAFVGDGINDAPVLARADVGIAMGALGSDAAIEAADVVLMDDRPSQIAIAIRIARGTMRIARQNIFFALAIKLAILALAAVGLAPMWLAVFGDVGVMILCVLNATRALRLS